MYGDALQAIGDPRGELIALDLHLETHGVTRDYFESWQRAMVAWLGAQWMRSYAYLWPTPQQAFRFGFLEDLQIRTIGRDRTADMCRRVLASPAGAFLRGAKITDSARGIREVLDVLAGHVHPWLDRLSLDQDTRRDTPPTALAGILGAAVPRLREVRVAGRRAAATPLPASVRRLVIDDVTALDVLEVGSSNVVELDLRIHGVGPRVIADVARQLGPARFPVLSRLDLSRCPYNPRAIDGDGEPLRLVALLEAPQRLRSLRIMSPVTEYQRQLLADIVVRWPGLAIETVAR